MKYRIQSTGIFKKDLKRIKKRGYRMQLLEEVVTLLSEGETLPVKYKDHILSGNFADYRECHVTPDWILVYRIEDEYLYLVLSRTGSHSDIFG
jgi:mRNA interferase YafQ